MSFDPRILNAKTQKDLDEQWDSIQWEQIQKVVLGDLGEDSASFGRIGELLEKPFEKLTHLYLWGIENLEHVFALPEKLSCLQIRKCASLKRIPSLKDELEELVIEECPGFEGWAEGAEGDDPQLNKLIDLSLKDSPRVPEEMLRRLLLRAPHLKKLDLSGHGERTQFDLDLVGELKDLRLNRCASLTLLLKGKAEATHFAPCLRHLELRATSLAQLPTLSLGGLGEGEGLDFVDLQDMSKLLKLPRLDLDSFPGTLLLSGSGLDLPPEVLGEEGENVARALLAHLQGERVPYHEVKIILIGNGRVGKTSLARALVGKDFHKKQSSTDGIQLWRLTKFPFDSVKEEGRGGEQCEADLNLWDFAGQDLYHNTHRLFFDNKAVFILCDSCWGDGADAETDKSAENIERSFWDEKHNTAYWIAQIRALAGDQGEGTSPQILFVRTKSDRDDEVDPLESKQILDEFWAEREPLLKKEGIPIQEKFGAESREGLGGLKDWLKGAVSRTLGTQGKREIQAKAFEVKKALEVMRDGNAGGPPRKILGIDEFKTLAEEQCRGLEYAENPGLLIDLFHKGGLLYANREHLPKHIILDQAWAIQAIYTPLGWESKAWEKLKGAHGRCTMKELKEWGWGLHEEETRGVFLGLMLSCGMAISLGELFDGEEEYLIVGAAPERKSVRELVEGHLSSNLREENAMDIKGPSVSRSAVLRLLSILGGKWGRHGSYWRWGGQFESFRFSNGQKDRTVLVLNWSPKDRDPENYSGYLTIKRFGPDSEFTNAVQIAAMEVPGLKKALFPHGDAPTADRGRASLEAFAPGESEVCIEVGISYAGLIKQDDLVREDFIEALKAALRAYGCKVFEYVEEQEKPESERDPGRKSYMDALVRRDLVLGVLTLKYLKSQWCMYEFMRLMQRVQESKKADKHGVSLRAFEEAYASEDLKREHEFDFVGIMQHWKAKYREFDESIRKESSSRDGARWTACAEARACWEWYRYVSKNQGLPLLREAFRGKSIEVKRLNLGSPARASATDWVRDILVTRVSNSYFFLRASLRAFSEYSAADEGQKSRYQVEFLEFLCHYYRLQVSAPLTDSVQIPDADDENMAIDMGRVRLVRLTNELEDPTWDRLLERIQDTVPRE